MKFFSYSFYVLLVSVYADPSFAVSADDLSSQALPCKMPEAKRPKLIAEKSKISEEAIRTGWYISIYADFNGDGWCDFALGIPYPVNSKMESYELNQLLVLGAPNSWLPPLKGRKTYLPPISSLNPEIWPVHRIDLTNIRFVHHKGGGAPYILGVGTSSDEPKRIVTNNPWCEQYTTVHRWDDNVDGLKKVDDATRDVVLSFYYSRVEKPCNQLAKEQAGGDSASK